MFRFAEMTAVSVIGLLAARGAGAEAIEPGQELKRTISPSGLVPTKRRERRQTQDDARPEIRNMAQDDARHRGLVRGACEGPLLASPVSAHQVTPRRKESHLAVAASMLTAVCFMLRNQKPYATSVRSNSTVTTGGKTIGRLVRRLQDLGCEVQIKNAA